MTRSEKNAVHIFNRGGVIPASEWTSGSGRHKKFRPMPAHCCRVYTSEFSTLQHTGRLHAKVVQAVKSLTQKRPRLQNLIVVHDYDAVLLLSAKERLAA